MRKRTIFVVAAIFCFCIIALSLPVRAHARPVSVAVLPLQVSGDNAALLQSVALDMLQSKLGRDAAVEVIKTDSVKAALAGTSGEITDIRAALIGAKLNADYVLYGGMRADARTSSMELKLLTIKDGAITPVSAKGTGADAIVGILDAVSAQVLSVVSVAMPAPAPVPAPVAQAQAAPNQTVAPKAADDGFIIKSSEATERPSMRKSKRMDGLYKAILSVDLDKDGEKEIFLLGRQSVAVGRLKADAFEVIQEIKTPVGLDNVAITAVDSNNDGSVELYVSGVLNDAPSASVIEWKDGGYNITASALPWFVRAFKDETGASVLVGQKLRRLGGFYGELHKLRLVNGSLVDAGVFMASLPENADIYRTELFDLTGNGALEAVVLDQRGYFRVYAGDPKGGWKKLYQSKDWFGGSLNRIETQDDIGAQKKEPVIVEGAFFAVDYNNDGRPEIIVKRNYAGGLGRYAATPSSYTDAEIVNVSWDKDAEGLLENWKSKKVEGYIADFYIETDPATGVRELVMLIVEGTGGYSGGIKSYILSHRLAI
ncbi:MAG: VCBS repeat-containing protein [Deltaproteobacteria bacterium]|nr:VCBS repeat-containing protein [Deltaproteobacteria bacterium]